MRARDERHGGQEARKRAERAFKESAKGGKARKSGRRDPDERERGVREGNGKHQVPVRAEEMK